MSEQASETQNSADFVTILSSELIADVMQVYFTEKLFKIPVRIVDLKPSADGYAFSLAFDSMQQSKNIVQSIDNASINGVSSSTNPSVRSHKAKTVQKEHDMADRMTTTSNINQPSTPPKPEPHHTEPLASHAPRNVDKSVPNQMVALLEQVAHLTLTLPNSEELEDFHITLRLAKRQAELLPVTTDDAVEEKE